MRVALGAIAVAVTALKLRSPRVYSAPTVNTNPEDEVCPEGDFALLTEELVVARTMLS